jgi:hypothetical protein
VAVSSLYRRARWRARKRKKAIAAGTGVVAVAVVVYVLWPGPNLRTGSAVVSSAQSVGGGRVPVAYRIVYRHEDRSGGRLSVSTEVLSVRRPFEGRDDTRRAGKIVGTTVNGFTRVKTERVILALPPAVAPQDLRPDVFVPQAVRDGYAQLRETRRVLGRTCRVVRSATESGSGTVPPLRKAAGSYIDRCFDDSGMMLEQVSYIGDRLADRRLATRVDESPSFDAKEFDVSGPTLPANMGGGSVKQLTDTSRLPGSFWMLPSVPKGLSHRGRYAVVPPQSELTDFEHRSSIVATVDDVWVGGPDVLVVEQGGTLGGAAAFGPDANARSVSVGALGSGELLSSYRGTEIRVKTDKAGHFVIVSGTFAPDRLLAIARSLVKEAGGALTVR